MEEKWLHPLEELGKEDNDIVGKKCANLGEMAKAGLPVPYGFALSVNAYTSFLSRTGAGDEIAELVERRPVSPQDIAGINELSASIRAIVESKEMTDTMRSVILSRYDALCARCNSPDLPVSVRSAGTVSHPGQYETYLNVKGKADLLDKIRKVWASTFNSRSLAFRLNKGMPLNNEPIGVAILAMVQARSAGIAFSADPNTGDLTKIIVEANWGLGESVVSGELMPDRWILEKESFKILDKTLGKKEKAVVSGVSGITEEELSKEKASAFSLSDEEVKGIGKFVVDLETLFGVPQDIEWAVSTEPSSPPIVLLQARPVVIAKKSTADQVIDMMVNLLTVS